MSSGGLPGKQNATLENRHHLLIGTSGSGKSHTAKAAIAKAGRVLVWDPDEDYNLPRLYSLGAFARAVAACIQQGKPLRFALTVDATAGNFEQFCKIITRVMCASRPMVVVVEEVADVVNSGKASHYWGIVARRGRKYGLTLYAVTQRPAECDKTIYSQTPYKWVGVLENEQDRKRLAGLIGVTVADLAGLHPHEAYYKRPGPDPAVKILPKKSRQVVKPKVKGRRA